MSTREATKRTSKCESEQLHFKVWGYGADKVGLPSYVTWKPGVDETKGAVVARAIVEKIGLHMISIQLTHWFEIPDGSPRFAYMMTFGRLFPNGGWIYVGQTWFEV